jgi:hypothetical protein
MRAFRACVAAALAAGLALGAQADESYAVAGEHPRLLLRPRHLRLLRRERERASVRWQQFDTLIAGRAVMPEPGLALALYYQASGDEAVGRRAVEWALGPANDPRQLALVFDWCQPVLSAAQSKTLAARLERALEQPPRDATVPEARSRAFAAVAIADEFPALSKRELRRIVVDWWRGRIIPALKSGRDVLPRREFYALFELLHAVRDNLGTDLREAFPPFFLQLPLYELLSYYPASYPAAESEYRIPAMKGAEIDLEAAAMSRAAELAMVAYDPNAVEVQYLQGWAMHDRFQLRSPLGAPYEYLWANPYQPGLSYFNLPLVVHDAIVGRLFVRSRWDDDAIWLGCFDGQLQTFVQGAPKIVPLSSMAAPAQFGDTVVVSAPRFRIVNEAKTVYIVGLEPKRAYDVEPDHREMQFPNGFTGGIRVKPVGVGRAGDSGAES